MKTDVLICFSDEGYTNYKDRLKSDGYLFYDNSLVNISKPNKNSHSINAFKLSKQKFNKTIFGNIIMLGYLIGHNPFVSIKSIKKVIAETVPKNTIDQNISALSIGFNKAIKEK